MDKIAPCKNCADRALGCHGICVDYVEWAKQQKAKHAWLKKQNSNIVIRASHFTGTSPKPGKHRKTKGTHH